MAEEQRLALPTDFATTAKEETDEKLRVSPLTADQRLVGRAFSNAEGKPSWLLRLLQAQVVVYVAFTIVDPAQGSNPGTNPDGTPFLFEPGAPGYELVLVANVCFMLSYPAMMLALESCRAALRPLDGFSAKLGVGTVKISKKESSSLWRWRIGQRVFAVLWFLMGLMGLFNGPYWDYPLSKFVPTMLVCTQFFTIYPLAFAVFWPALRAASAVARVQANAVIAKVKRTDPHDESAWAAVEKEALKLNDLMQDLSNGFGMGFLGVTMCMWLWALSFFSNAINGPLMRAQDKYMNDYCVGYAGEPEKATMCGNVSESTEVKSNGNGYLRFCIVLVPLPLLFAADIAATSSICDELLEQLNLVAVRAGPALHTKIDWLETRLRRMHHGQGIGFAVGPLIVDRKTLITIGALIGGGMTTVLTVLFALAEEPTAVAAASGGSACDLSLEQVAVIRSFSLNASCSYDNVSIGSVRRLKSDDVRGWVELP